ncbi:hypothetical protein D9M73_168890 [compost metagenome]
MTEDLVENVRLLQVIKLFAGPNKGRHRKLLAGQQFEKGLEGNQCGNPGNLPAGGFTEDLVDFAELRNAVVGQTEFFDTVQVLLARTPFDHFQLTSDQRVPHRVFFGGVVDKTLRIGLASHVLRLLHAALLLGDFVLVMYCYGPRNTPRIALLQQVIGVTRRKIPRYS